MQVIENSRPRLSDAFGGLAAVLRQGREQDQTNQNTQDTIQGQKDVATQKTAAEQAKARADAIKTVMLNADSDPQTWGRAYAQLQQSDPEAAKFIPDISTLPQSDFQQAKDQLRMQENHFKQQTVGLQSDAAERIKNNTPNRTDAATVFNPQSAGTAPYNQEQLADVLGGRFSKVPPSPNEMQAAKVETKIAPDAGTVLKEKTEGPLRVAQANAANASATESRASARQKDAAAKATATVQDGSALQPGSPDYKLATDVATGVLTMDQLRGLFSRNKADSNRKIAVYNTARQINPDFDPANFELGYAMAKNPKVRQQVASLNNALSSLADAKTISDNALRTGVPALNGIVLTGGFKLGGKTYSNFQTYQLALADEVSGALGFGTATDEKLRLAKMLTEPTKSPEQFSSDIDVAIRPFLERKRGSLIDQMGRYGSNVTAFGSGGGQPASPKNSGASADQAFITKAMGMTNPATGKPYTQQEAQQELARRKGQ